MGKNSSRYNVYHVDFHKRKTVDMQDIKGMTTYKRTELNKIQIAKQNTNILNGATWFK